MKGREELEADWRTLDCQSLNEMDGMDERLSDFNKINYKYGLF